MKQWLGLIARLVVGGVWIVAGALKLADPYESVRAVRAYQLLPEAVVPTVGHLLPVLEIVVGLMLILGLLTRAAAAVSALLFLAFVIGIASVWVRGIEIECGCFGGGGAKAGAAALYPWEIARDAGLFALSAFLVWLRGSKWALDSVILGRAPDDLFVALEEDEPDEPDEPEEPDVARAESSE